MKLLYSILGAIVAIVLAFFLCEPIYDLIWPGATDKREGGVGFFFFFMLAPLSVILGAIAGALLYANFSKKR